MPLASLNLFPEYSVSYLAFHRNRYATAATKYLMKLLFDPWRTFDDTCMIRLKLQESVAAEMLSGAGFPITNL